MGLHDRSFRDSLAAMLDREEAPTAHEVLDLLVDRFVPDITIEDLPFHQPRLYAKKRLVLMLAQKVYEDSPAMLEHLRALNTLDRHAEANPDNEELLNHLVQVFLATSDAVANQC